MANGDPIRAGQQTTGTEATELIIISNDFRLMIGK
jgi:hypothetical protein